VGNDPAVGFGSSNTKIAQVLRDGAAPHLEAITLNYAMKENSVTILADAVKDGLFAGLVELCVEDDVLDVRPLLRAIVNAHKCHFLKKWDVYSDDVSIVTLRNAFTVGAFPVLTHIVTPWVGWQDEEDVISFIHVLET